MNTQKLITDLRLFASHVEQAIAHLEAAEAVGVKRGRGRPRKLTVGVTGIGTFPKSDAAKHAQPTDNNGSGRGKLHSGL